jgi:HK97 family phage prohead protease
MPWTVSDVDRFNKGLTDEQKKQWVKVANSVYDKCIEDGGTDEKCGEKAVHQANGVVKKRSMDKEIRSWDITDCEIRATRRGRTIEGFGIVFNKESKDLGGFQEIIKPEAVEGVIERSDILALLNHDESKGVLARSTNGEGTLELSPENFGVKYRFEAPDTVLGDEVLSGVRRGDIRTSSFSFSVSKGQKWEKRSDGTYLRTITKFDKIYDVSPVYREAYADTTVAVRNLIEIRTEEAEKTAAEAQKRIADLEEELSKKTSSDSTDVKGADPVEDLTKYFENLEKQIPKK